ncbi:MAG: DUF6076 domain-containing protein [Lachnospiraceae bacterium]|nr:DUF6076 domain-containing protein [Lachnospiraceae bacterium]
MIEGTKRTNEKINTIQEFTLMFWQNQILIDKIKIPLGQCTNDILNLSDEYLTQINNSRNELALATQTLFNPNINKDLANVTEIQNKLNKVLDLVLALPPFHYLIDNDFGHSMLIDIFNCQPNEFLVLTNRESHQGQVLNHLIFKLISIIDETIAFKQYISAMLELYFEKLKKRNEEHYAVGVYSFFANTKLLNEIRITLPPLPSFDFAQAREVGIEYAPMRNPDNKKQYLIAERIVFKSMGGFLHLDFFRGLMNGHCPRQCHNCGKYFLLLSGHNTCYCANVAPNQKKEGDTKTCRDIGAHIKETQKKEKRTPAQQEYEKVYNRLKTRKNRGKLSVDEWNKQVAQAISYMEQNMRGELSDFEFKEIMKKF